MFGKTIIPNTLTMLNLVMGCAALLAHNVQDAFVFVLLAALADLLDGLVARAIGATSEMGKQLDSLADVVSFEMAGIAETYLPNGISNNLR